MPLTNVTSLQNSSNYFLDFEINISSNGLFRGGNPIVMHFGTNYDFVEKGATNAVILLPLLKSQSSTILNSPKPKVVNESTYHGHFSHE